MRVLGDRVLVALPPTVDEITTASGIVLVKDPDRFQTPTRGIVVALGEKTGTADVDDLRAVFAEWIDPLCPTIEPSTNVVDLAYTSPYVIRDHIAQILSSVKPAPFDVALDDLVIFPASAGEEIEEDGIRYVILRESEIIGIQEKEAAA